MVIVRYPDFFSNVYHALLLVSISFEWMNVMFDVYCLFFWPKLGGILVLIGKLKWKNRDLVCNPFHRFLFQLQYQDNQ